MPTKPKRIYWDSCSFIHFFQETAEYLDALNEIDTWGKAEKCVVVTSSVSIAEVCKLPDIGMLPLEQTKKIMAYMENEWIEMWQADRLVCEEAHHITRLHGLKPMDAIHMATALMAKVDVVVTTDSKKYRRGGLLKYDGRIGNPPLVIRKPDIGTIMPLWASAIHEEENDEDE